VTRLGGKDWKGKDGTNGTFQAIDMQLIVEKPFNSELYQKMPF